MDTLQAQKLARELMDIHHLQGWRFAYDNAVRRFGCCHYTTRTISLSRKMVELNNEDSVRDTILHEIAHAIAGGNAGHGPKWIYTAKSIGCTGERCYSRAVTQTVPPRYTATCAYCGYVSKRHRKPSCRYSCSTCGGGRFNENYLLVFIKA